MSQPNYAVSPSDYIEEWLEDEEVSQAELARRMGVSGKHISKVMHGAPLSDDFILRLERVTNIPAKFWTGIEANYRQDLQRISEAEALEAEKVPVDNRILKSLRDRGLISATRKSNGRLWQELMQFMRVGSPSSLLDSLGSSHAATAYRSGKSRQSAAVALWIAAGRYHVESLAPIPQFDMRLLESMLPQLRSLSREKPSVYGQQLVEQLSSAGVYLAYVKDLPLTDTYGATWWRKGNPIIQLSLRRRGDDFFWFTLFHEIGHILKHSKQGVFVHQIGESLSEAEREADDFASDLLVPPALLTQLHGRMTLSKVQQLAEENGISPGILVGRCRHMGIFGQQVGHGLIKSLEIAAVDD